MANENVEWVENPWREPSQASVKAILKRLGLGQDGERVDPSAPETLSVEDNQILTAAGTFGSPHGPTAKGADFSKFSGVEAVGNGDNLVYYAYRDGEIIGQRKPTGDETFDTVAFWNEVAG